ncbi:stage II sporulation protein M [Austwickia chelonae]|uniref:stage II sporulation protein M n=1 Tax=Austwickia chelonae TaxID=100225 RepID=UPI000E25A687|nr:stage II sporulation protein M [Austwickia chelonae]
MDVDAYVAAHLPQWRRLEQLISHRNLSCAEADEMLDLYQRTATHLSAVRSASPDPQLIAYLSWLLSRTRAHSARPGRSEWGSLLRFFTHTFPGTLYRIRYWWLATLAVNLLVALALGWWFLNNPHVEQTMMSAGQVRQLVEHDFANYYVENAASSFAFRVWTNNAYVSALCITLGVLGFPVIGLLWTNILNLAVIGALMTRHGRADVFYGLILPHGLLELTCVFVAGGVGLRLFWSWVEPGARSRAQSFAAEARAAMSVAMGLALVLLLCGLIEGFVTPSGLPTAARIGIGALAEVLFLAYVYTLGRSAYLEGETGDLTADRGGYVGISRE